MIFNEPEYLDPLLKINFQLTSTQFQVKLVDLQLHYSNIIILSDEIYQILFFLII